MERDYTDKEYRVMLELDSPNHKRFTDLLNAKILGNKGLSLTLDRLEHVGLVKKDVGDGLYYLTKEGEDSLAIEEAKLETEWSQGGRSAGDLYRPTRIFFLMARDLLLPPSGTRADNTRQIAAIAAGGITLGAYSAWLTLRKGGWAPTKEETQCAKWMRRLYVDSVDSSSIKNEQAAEPVLKSTWTLAKAFRDQILHFNFGAAFDSKLSADVISKLTANWDGQFEEFYKRNGVKVERDSHDLLKILGWYVLKRIAMGRRYFDLVAKDLLLTAAKELESSRS